ncbi:MAG: hypothetical protein AAF747_03940 [Planctomycetota bacterium]
MTAPKAPAPIPAPLGAVLGLTFVNSLGTGAVTNGFGFIVEQAYGSSDTVKFGLGVVLGITYIAGAFAVGPVLRRATAALPGLSTRGATLIVLLALGGLCFVPVLVPNSLWAFLVLILGYSPLSGALWALVESYLAGGRRGVALRRATGWFNLSWAGAVAMASWLMAPLLEGQPLAILGLLGLAHVLSAGFLVPLRPEPARHAEEEARDYPAIHRDLLRAFRVLLPLSYVVFSAWTPYAPTATAAVGLPIVWQTPVTSIWQIARVATFFVMQRWSGWHGRWATAVVGAGLLLGGFAIALGSTAMTDDAAGGVQALPLTVLVIGLAALGVGMGAVYAAALYYAMAVGNAAVDAGGTHEGLVGIGYTAGPMCGLAAVGLAGAGVFPDANVQTLIFVLVAATCLAAIVPLAAMLRKARRNTGLREVR